MSNEEISSKWSMPYNLGYDKLKKILRALYQKKANENMVSSKDISKIVDLNQGTIGSNLIFLTHIGVLEGSGQVGYKLTSNGNEYVKAISENNSENIKKYLGPIIENSHLKKLKEYVEFNIKSLTINGLNNCVQREGQFPLQKDSENMQAPYSTGAKALYEIFKTAGIIPNDFQIITTTQTNKPKTQHKQKKKGHKESRSVTSAEDTIESSSEYTVLKTSEFSLSIRKDLDNETFDHIKSQINSEIEFRRKQTKSGTNSQNN